MDNSYQDFLEKFGLDEATMLEARKLTPAPQVESGTHYFIAPSSIEGVGVFAYKDLAGDIGTFMGGTDWYTLGRYMNHSATPNCHLEIRDYNVIVVGNARAGEELTVSYFHAQEMMSIKAQVTVVDDFCEELELVIASAQASGFGTWQPNKGDVGTSHYEGMNFWGHHALMLRPLVLAVNTLVLPNSMFFRSTNEGMEQAYIHSDRESGAHTCVAYLSQHEQPTGTAFFRHKPTGLTSMPSFHEMKDQGIFEQLKDDMVGRNPDAWEQIGYVEGQCNRAVIFEAPLFHSRFPLEGIGSTPEDGRLVWVSHFYKMNGMGDLN